MIVYTAIFGGHDALKPLPAGVRGVCFADAPLAATGWDVRPPAYKDADPRLCARHHKAMAHELFPGEDTLWIDGSISLHEVPPVAEFGAFRHSGHTADTAQEIAACKGRGKITANDALAAENRLAAWKADGFPDDGGHPETGALMRQDTERTRAFNALWWELIQQCPRDQLSCDYARWRTGLPWTAFPGTILRTPLVSLLRHAERPAAPGPVLPRIYYFTPYDKRGIGVAYNECCRIVPDDAWVCLTDRDVIYPCNFGDAVQDAIARDPGVDVWTTCATRINCNEGLVCPGGAKDEERDLVTLFQKSVQWSKDHAGQVERLKTMHLGGYFMLFRKTLWNSYPFPEVIAVSGRGARKGCTVLGIDTTWSHDVAKAGKVFGLIKGLLAVHYYTLHGNRSSHFYELEMHGRHASAGTSTPHQKGSKLYYDRATKKFRRRSA